MTEERNHQPEDCLEENIWNEMRGSKDEKNQKVRNTNETVWELTIQNWSPSPESGVWYLKKQ